MAKQTFKEKLGHWLWNINGRLDDKDYQVAVANSAHRLRMDDGLLVDDIPLTAEMLEYYTQLHHILSGNDNEVACLLGMLIGPDFSNDMDEHIVMP